MQPIGFIGAGNMAEAIVSGLLRKALIAPGDITVFDVKHERSGHMKTTYGVEIAPTAQAVVLSRDIIILAVKPDKIMKVLNEISSELSGKLVISIAAGITLKSMLDVLGKQAKAVRVMPNTPCLVLEGASVMSLSSSCSDHDRAAVLDIFSAVGICLEMEEKFINAVTALSGSGPAFCFLFLEALSDGAVKAGLPREVALRLAAATMKGAACMVLELGKHPGQLKDMVTSPSGTTIEGIAALESKGFRSAVIDAVSAAYRRAEILSTKG
jgi:pyrroline-5-carboxylate reductase